MKKKILALMLACALAAGTAACGSSDSDSTQTDDTASEDTSASDSEEESVSEVADFEPITVVDNDSCAIIITELDEDNMWGYSLVVSLENKTSDKTLMFSVDEASINNVSSDPVFASEVASGKKSNETVSFSDSDFEEYGVGDVTDIMLSFRVYDSDDWSADDIAYETVHVYPQGEDAATSYVRADEDGDILLVDNDQVKVVVIGNEIDSIWGFTLNLYLENKTDSAVMFSVDQASVNGYMEDPYWADSVPAGTVAFGQMYWNTDTLEADGITDVENIEFLFNAVSEDDYYTDYVNETFTVDIQ